MSNVPSVLNFEQNEERSDMNVDTSILDPVVNTTTNCRFIIPNKGLLYSKTCMINLGVKMSNEGEARSAVFLPLVNGVYSMIDRAVLKIGTKVIGEIKDLNYWMSFYSGLLHPRVVRQQEQILTGRGLAVGVSPYSAASSNQEPILNNGYTFNSYDATGMAAQQLDKYDLFIPDYNNMVATTDNITQYQVSLKELFPFLDDYKLPLYLMKEQISIELFYTQNDDHTCIDVLGGVNNTAKVNIDHPSVFMIIDYIYYDEDKMDELRSEFMGKDNGRLFFVEQQLVTSSIAIDAEGSAFLRNMGGAGRLVNKIVSMSNPVLTSTQKLNSILNAYHASAPNDNLSYNLIYNDERLFPVNVTNMAHVASNLKYSEGPLYVPVSQYNRDILDPYPQQVYGLNVTEMSGERFYISTKLQKNKRINQRGIILQNYGTYPIAQVTNRSWLEINKIYQLDSNGYVEISFR